MWHNSETIHLREIVRRAADIRRCPKATRRERWKRVVARTLPSPLFRVFVESGEEDKKSGCNSVCRMEKRVKMIPARSWSIELESRLLSGPTTIHVTRRSFVLGLLNGLPERQNVSPIFSSLFSFFFLFLSVVPPLVMFTLRWTLERSSYGILERRIQTVRFICPIFHGDSGVKPLFCCRFVTLEYFSRALFLNACVHTCVANAAQP